MGRLVIKRDNINLTDRWDRRKVSNLYDTNDDASTLVLASSMLLLFGSAFKRKKWIRRRVVVNLIFLAEWWIECNSFGGCSFCAHTPWYKEGRGEIWDMYGWWCSAVFLFLKEEEEVGSPCIIVSSWPVRLSRLWKVRRESAVIMCEPCRSLEVAQKVLNIRLWPFLSLTILFVAT